MYHNAYVHYRNGAVHLQFLKDGKRLSSGSGFICNGKLVTNNHVIQCDSADTVLLRTPTHSKTDPNDGISLTYLAFQERFLSGSDKTKFDYAILDIPELIEIEHYNFKLSRRLASFGREYAIFGYPLDHSNLTLHRAMVSSIYEKLGVTILQLDASVNNGNSGGPLVELSTGEVVGIVTRKNNGLTEAFDKLYSSIDDQKQLVEEGFATYLRPGSTYSPKEQALANLDHLKELCKQIKRSANTGIGYAFSIEHIAQDYIFEELHIREAE